VGSTFDGLLDLLAELAYRVWIFDGDALLRLRTSDESFSENVVAAPRDWHPPDVP
jgi:hypothetical protein